MLHIPYTKAGCWRNVWGVIIATHTVGLYIYVVSGKNSSTQRRHVGVKQFLVKIFIVLDISIIPTIEIFRTIFECDPSINITFYWWPIIKLCWFHLTEMFDFIKLISIIQNLFAVANAFCTNNANSMNYGYSYMVIDVLHTEHVYNNLSRFRQNYIRRNINIINVQMFFFNN